MVRLDMVERVEVVDHQAVGLLHALARGIAQEIQAFQAGAVAEMEAGHRIERLAGWKLRLQEVIGGKRSDGLSRLLDVAAVVERGQRAPRVLIDRG